MAAGLDSLPIQYFRWYFGTTQEPHIFHHFSCLKREVEQALHRLATALASAEYQNEEQSFAHGKESCLEAQE